MTIKEFAEKLKKISRSCLGGYLVCETDLDYLISQAEQERTNFEKWKDELTVEKFTEIILGSPDYVSCEHCPLLVNYECSMSTIGCEEALTKWANERCEE